MSPETTSPTDPSGSDLPYPEADDLGLGAIPLELVELGRSAEPATFSKGTPA